MCQSSQFVLTEFVLRFSAFFTPKMANKQFSWNMRSPIAPSNFVMRAEPDKVFDSVVPVQMQLSTTTDERHNFVRLTVELIPTGLSTSSFRKVR